MFKTSIKYSLKTKLIKHGFHLSGVLSKYTSNNGQCTLQWTHTE